MCEILAPAGSEMSALAAINAGADAIYLGLEKFSARSSAENFDEEGFAKISRAAHAFGVKVYVALNTVVKDCELESFIKTAVQVWNSGADALIVQDLFLGKFLKEKFPRLRLHLSTQAGVCNEYGARLAEKYGFERVILARETEFSDIEKIAKIIETEVFVQGALCTCFSGQCYMSSFAGGNSGNRGMCKQPCRKRYSIDRKGFEEAAYRLSLSDLCVGEDILRLKAAGVASFKIEGRMRRPEYVSAAVAYYRNILGGKDSGLSELKRTYNRGNYTKGLAFGQDKSFISSAVQGHIGEFAGAVKVENSKYVCQSGLKFTEGDGFKILRDGKEIGGGSFGGNCKGGFVINTRTRLKNGDKAFVTTDTRLNEKLLSVKKTLPVRICVKLLSGRPAEAEINGITVFGDTVLEQAKSRPLTEEDVVRCFGKTDGFPFSPECSVETDGAFTAVSALNNFRRKVYSEYFEFISAHKNSPVKAEFVLPALSLCENNLTAVIAESLDGVEADVGILKPHDYSRITPAPDSFGGEKFLFVPPYLTGAEAETVMRAAENFDGIYCDGYFGLEIAKAAGKKFFAGTGFNITNSVSVDGCPADYFCISKELTCTEADALSVKNSFYLTEGNIKVMDLIYCPFEKKCGSCDKRGEYTLTDENGRKFPLRRYRVSGCRFEVYNCASLGIKKCRSGRLIDKSLKTGQNLTRGHSEKGIN